MIVFSYTYLIEWFYKTLTLSVDMVLISSL